MIYEIKFKNEAVPLQIEADEMVYDFGNGEQDTLIEDGQGVVVFNKLGSGPYRVGIFPISGLTYALAIDQVWAGSKTGRTLPTLPPVPLSKLPPVVDAYSMTRNASRCKVCDKLIPVGASHICKS